MREEVIVGAGLSGLVAAINLARQGFKVFVRERRESAGGLTDIKGLESRLINIGDGTPINLERMSAYIGIDISPATVPLRECRNHIYGRTIDVKFAQKTPAYLVERGPRRTSLDVYLYELALSEGVDFSFRDTVEDFDSLPPDSIVATGLFDGAWEALDVPHLPVFGYLAVSETEDLLPRVIIYFDEYTRDYAFYSQVNGARGAVLFSRGKPLDPDVKDRFKDQLARNDGIEFDAWDAVNFGALPVRHIKNPQLFAKNKILAGTLSGTMDPFLLFGVHGALVSGKIAAMAVTDHWGALQEFKRINKYYSQGWLRAQAYQQMPMWLLKRVTWTAAGMYEKIAPYLGDKLFHLLPGFGRI